MQFVHRQKKNHENRVMLLYKLMESLNVNYIISYAHQNPQKKLHINKFLFERGHSEGKIRQMYMNVCTEMTWQSFLGMNIFIRNYSNFCFVSYHLSYQPSSSNTQYAFAALWHSSNAWFWITYYRNWYIIRGFKLFLLDDFYRKSNAYIIW